MISVQTLDRKIWRKDLLFAYLQKCHDTNTTATIDFSPEGSCATALGLYRLLDDFCKNTGYLKSNVTIKTGNMVESHDEYNIIKIPQYWYEVKEIQKWLKGKTLDTGNTPTKHFSNFTSRSNWFRLWTATILATKYADKTIQTYHYDPDRENYNYNGYVGVDDLFSRNCDLIPEAVEFIQSCPRTIDIEFLKNLDNTEGSIFQHENSYYPIQHPSNLNLLQYYNNIFVDVVVEPNISGNCFLVTEKLWRPIIARRPFIVVSTAGYLYNLRKLGFKTFNDFWDEGYDEYSASDRITQIGDLLEHLSQMSVDELNLYLVKIKDILDHNYTRFNELTYTDISKAFS